MRMTRVLVCVTLAACMISTSGVRAADNQAELQKLKAELDAISAELNRAPAAIPSQVDAVVANGGGKFGPDAAVTTRNGNLKISGLVQVWYYSIQNDNRGLFDDAANSGVLDTNEGQDNDSFRIRRAEIKFTMDIHENIAAVVMIDPAREDASHPTINANQGLFKRRNNVSPEFDAANGPGLGSTGNIGLIQSGGGPQVGAGAVPRLLQDAYIWYHGVIPHHDVRVGQFKPFFGEEGIRSSAELDFVERSLVGNIGDFRDLGMTIHGTWWDGRFQYWGGVFDGAGNYYLSSGQYQNRSDDNDEKDYVLRMLIRPVWDDCKWGKLEIGGSSQIGTKGESSARDPFANPLNGLNRNRTSAMKHAAWLSYEPAGVVSGWWLKGEYLFIRDRNASGTVVDFTDSGNHPVLTFIQTDSGTFPSHGFYAATGYKFENSSICNLPCWLKPFEIAVRYEQFENVQVADVANPTRTDNFQTKVWTVGLNYYIKGHNAKLQANYSVVDDPEGTNAGLTRVFHEVRNDSFVVNFQVAF